MVKDKRYSTVKNLILGGYIKNFRDIFDVVPKSVVVKDLKTNNQRFTRMMDNVGLFYTRELFKIAELIEVDEIEIMKLVCNQYVNDRKVKKKK